MNRATISVIMITLDEEERLAAALDSVRWADEIVIVDSGSTDRTAEIARRYTERFVVRDWPGYGIQKQRALDLATGDWVLSLDADEVVTPELRSAIESMLAQPGGLAGFKIERHTFYLGHWFGRRGWRRDRIVRMFRRDRARFDGAPVHERVLVDGRVGRLTGILQHYTYRDIAHHLDKMNRYTSVLARQHHERGRRSGALQPLLRGASHFVSRYVLRAGFLDGRAGLLRAALGATYSFLTYAKLWELDVQEHQDPGARSDPNARAVREGESRAPRAEETPSGLAPTPGADRPAHR